MDGKSYAETTRGHPWGCSLVKVRPADRSGTLQKNTSREGDYPRLNPSPLNQIRSEGESAFAKIYISCIAFTKDYLTTPPPASSFLLSD